MQNTEFVVLVDEENREIGLEEKLSAHRNGSLHRAFSIFIFRVRNQKLETLLQQRNKNKYHCGNLWTNTCCGHPRAGEDIVVAAERRLMEEMHFSTQLEYLEKFLYFADCNNGLVEHELDHVLVGSYAQDIVSVNPDEVQDFKWITLADVASELLAAPTTFTPWFGQALALINTQLPKISKLLQETTHEELTV